jgi:hypothetical protein
VHAVGSGNDLDPWTGLGFSSTTTEQRAEFNARTSADVSQIRSAFARAKANNSRAVVLLTQADMFVGSGNTYRTAYQSIVRTIAAESASFGRPVYLFNGDTHVFRSDRPLTSSTWLSFYGIANPVPNLFRYTIEGGSSMNEWLKVTVVSGSSVLSVQRVNFR